MKCISITVPSINCPSCGSPGPHTCRHSMLQPDGRRRRYFSCRKCAERFVALVTQVGAGDRYHTRDILPDR